MDVASGPHQVPISSLRYAHSLSTAEAQSQRTQFQESGNRDYKTLVEVVVKVGALWGFLAKILISLVIGT